MRNEHMKPFIVRWLKFHFIVFRKIAAKVEAEG